MSCKTLSHVTVVEDFLVNQGAYWEDEFDLAGDDDQAMDLAGCSFAGVARRNRDIGTPVSYTFRFAVNLLTRKVKVWLEEEDTATLSIGSRPRDEQSTFYYDWEMTDSLGNVHRIQQGKNWIDRNLTRETN